MLKRHLRLATALWSGAAAVLAGVALLTLASRPAPALPAYTQQTGLSCDKCHTMPARASGLTRLGEDFKKNGHKVKP
jgi:hypothetical protein